MPEHKKTIVNKEDMISKGAVNEDKIPCPCAKIVCPCGCGNRYGGICLRKKPCKLCSEDASREIN